MTAASEESTRSRAERLLAPWLGACEVLVTVLGHNDALSAEAVRSVRPNRRQVPVQLYGSVALIGPMRQPGAHRAGCGHCLARRWQALRPATVRDALESGGQSAELAASPYLTPFVAATIAGLATGSSIAPGGLPLVYRLDMDTLHVKRFPLLPDPECPCCAEPPGNRQPEQTNRPDELAEPVAVRKPAPDRFRSRSLDEYRLPMAALANPVCGLLGAGVTNLLDSPTTASTMGAFAIRTDERLYEVFWGGHSCSYADSARIGVLEGLERYAGMRPRGDDWSVRATLRALDAEGQSVVDPRTCGLYSPEYHQARPWSAPFTPDREICWVAGYSLRDREPVLVPEVLSYYYSTPLPERFVQECSSGCASGGSLVEAAYFGLMELIERDAFLLTWYGRVGLAEIDPRTSADPAVRQMVDRLDMYGFQARFFDGRLTFPVPVVIAAAARRDGELGALCFGAGASLDPESALRSALDEIATDAPALRGRTEANLTRLRRMASDFDEVGSVHDHPLLYGLPEMAEHAAFLLDTGAGPGRPMSEVFADTAKPSLDLRADLERCVRMLASDGFDVVVVDQTSSQQRALGIHTACVLVPGLLPIDFGWARQRALRMPRMRIALRRAGVRAHDLDTTEFNTAPHPFP